MRSIFASLSALALAFLCLSLPSSTSSLKVAQRWMHVLQKSAIGNAIAVAVAFQGDIILPGVLHMQPSSSVVAVAAETKSILEGNYNDPNHPGCLRKVIVKDGLVSIIGSDNLDGSKQFTIKAKEDAPGVMFVDFSPKGGPSDLLGVYDEKSGGIKWPDGNMWTKIKG